MDLQKYLTDNRQKLVEKWIAVDNLLKILSLWFGHAFFC